MPLLSGQKERTVGAIKKLNELSVMLVAVFVLLGFFGIRFGCEKTPCFSLYMGLGADRAGSFSFLDLCEEDRFKCFQTLVEPSWSIWKKAPPVINTLDGGVYSVALNFTWERAYCFCLIKVSARGAMTEREFVNLTQDSVDLALEPGPTCDSRLGPFIVVLFATGTLLGALGELSLPKRRAGILLTVAASVFYAVALGVLYGAVSICPGVVYAQQVRALLLLCLAGWSVAICGLLYMLITDRTRCCSGRLISYKLDGGKSKRSSSGVVRMDEQTRLTIAL
jgi:hypothetical protein